MEISNTDRLAFRDMLRERKRVLEKTLEAAITRMLATFPPDS